MDLKEVVSAYYSIYEGKKKEDEKPRSGLMMMVMEKGMKKVK